MTTSLIELDGSLGEGGGQILRTSLALSLLTGRPFHLRNVRAGRARPGLQPQHLLSVQSAAAVGNGRVRGASLGSTDLVFEPGPIQPGSYRFDVGTAGATSLVLHTLYLPLTLGATEPSALLLGGGTHVTTSPSYHFLETTWSRYLDLFGIHVGLRLLRPGFYPRGGGQVQVSLQPCPHPRGVQLPTRDAAVRVTGFSAVAGLDRNIARRQLRRAVQRLERAGLTASLQEQSWEGGPGTVVHLVLDTRPVPTAFFALGARGRPAEQVADDAVDQVLHYLAADQALVDAHSADQIVLPLALAEGPTEYTVAEMTLHLTTNVAVIGRFLDRVILCEGEPGRPGRVRIT